MSPSPAHRKRVLVIEDEIIIAMMIEDMLADLEMDVVGPALDAPTAVQLASAPDLDFALLDVNLAGDTSFSAADVLQRRGVPFAFVTGYGRAGVREDLRGYPILGKPINPDALRMVLSPPPPLH